MQTPVACPACAGSLVGQSGCKLCEGTALVSRPAAARWHSERDRRLTGQFQNFETLALRSVELLESRKTETAMALAREGRILLARFERSAKMPHGASERTSVVTDLIDYEQRVLSFLTGSR